MNLELRLRNPFDKKEYSSLPSTNGIYIFKKGDIILYVGKSVNIKARVLSHVESAGSIEKEYAIVSQSDNLITIATDSEFNALILESSLIQKHKPKYNVIWKDDKSYLYIKISAEEYPKVYAVRRENDKRSKYFGPFSSVADVEDLLRFVRRVIPYCSQKKISRKSCFYSKIGRCNPCPNDIEKIKDPEIKAIKKKEYRTNIRRIISILNGRTDSVLKDFHHGLEDAIKNQEYEKGIEIRDKIHSLEYLIKYRSFDRRIEEDYNMSQKGLSDLKELVVRFFPELTLLKRIECYDISNLNQKQATASMVVATEGLIDKSQYRKFRIKNEKLQSDFDMLEEVVTRRFRNKWPHPDIIVIDGGKPQVKRVTATLSRIGIHIPVIGIAKRPDRLVMGALNFPTLRPKINNYGYRLVQHVRDESHRFARKYHLFLRNKKLI